MKKILTLFVCLLIVSAISVTAFAANETIFSVETSATSVYRGDTVTLTVSINSTEPATSYGLMLDYDTEVLELVGGACTVDDTLVSSFNNGFAFMFQNPTDYSGEVGTVTFKVKDSAVFGDVVIIGNASVKNGSAVVSSVGISASFTIVCNHNYGSWSESGLGHSQICAICGDVKTAEHNWDDGTITKEATCSEEGKKEFVCVDCGASKEETIDMIEHKYGDWQIVDGENHKRVCTVCPQEETAVHEY